MPSPTPTTPEVGTDKDDGKRLADRQRQATPTGGATSKAAAMGVSDNVVRVNNDNRAPMFKENDVEITETYQEGGREHAQQRGRGRREH